MRKPEEITEALIDEYGLLSIADFRKMDVMAIEKYVLPIELMMENAGLQLARLTSNLLPDKDKRILIGIGTGNNGGGGLVAARRLAGWGYNVYLDIPDKNLKPLPTLQLERALAFGVFNEITKTPGIFIDSYLGFSQRLPLPSEYKQALDKANKFDCLKISLDLPTGFDEHSGLSIFFPDIILSLAAMKKELLKQADNALIYLVDIGIPSKIYVEFGVKQPDFSHSGIIKLLKPK